MTTLGIREKPDTAIIPWYRKSWAIALYVLTGICLVGAGTFFLLAELYPPQSIQTINYTWTDENGIAHYSDTKNDQSAKEVLAIKRLTTSERIFKDINQSGAVVLSKLKSAGGILFVAISAILLGVAGVTRHRYRRKLRERKQRQRNLTNIIKDFKDFYSALSAETDKSEYHMRLAKLKYPLTDFKEASPALENHHEEAISLLSKALKTYADCEVLWNIKSREELAWANRNGYVIKYPLLVKMVGEPTRSGTRSMSSEIRNAVWKYASNYIEQAEAMFSNPPGK